MGRTLRDLAAITVVAAAAMFPHGALAATTDAGRVVKGTQVQMTMLPARSVAQLRAMAPVPGPPTARAPRPALRGERGVDPGSAQLHATADPATSSPARAPVRGPLLPQTPGTQFLGAQLSDSGAVPPDSMGAVGPTQYIVMINGRIRSFNKATGVADGVLDMTTNAFWGQAGTSDPRIRYDRLTDRWFFTMITAESPSNKILVGYTNGGVVTNSTLFQGGFFPVTNFRPSCAWDYDTLGIDASALYIGGNVFCNNVTTFAGSDGLVIPKAGLLANTPSPTHFILSPNGTTCGSGGDGPYSPQGVDNLSPGATQGFFIGISVCVFGRLDIARVSNPGTSPSATLLALSVPLTSSPLGVPALGSTVNLDATDDRLMAAHLRAGHLWTAHNICVNSGGVATVSGGNCTADRDAIRWYDIGNLAAAPSLNQSGTVFDPAATNPRFYFIPSLMVSGQGHVAMGSSVAGNLEHAEAATMGRLVGDSPGTMQTPVIYQASAFTYNVADSANPHRWGDYSYTSLDPSDDMTMWTIQEFTNANDSWGVEAVRLLAPPPATPTSSSGPVFTNRTATTLSVTGTSVSGSGFFDPAANIPNHLQAAITGGVVVNSVSYIDPTHVSLSLDTSAASVGPQDLTITNPDGQAVTVTGFVDVQPAPALPFVNTVSRTAQYTLASANNGATWVELDPANLLINSPGGNNRTALVTANADLWTSSEGYNQDLGIFVSHNSGADELLAWKESGGFAGTFSPNAAFVQVAYSMTGGDSYTFKLKWKPNKPAPANTIHAGAGPLGGLFSPTSLTVQSFPVGVVPSFGVTTFQQSLANSNGVTWQLLGASATLNPTGDSTAVLGGSADLWTDTAGYNQDLAIFVSDNSGGDQLVAWKESGGFAGTFSPNAAFVKATHTMVAGHSYTFKLKWKANRPASGVTIHAGAGPFNGAFSPTSLSAQVIPHDVNPLSGRSTGQFSLNGSNGLTWQTLSSATTFAFTPAVSGSMLLGGNIDLWTEVAGYNQDIGIFVSDNGGGDTLLAWKESGGFAGTFSPNAAFVQTKFAMTTGHDYVFKLKWKTNRNAPGVTIHAGAGPISGQFSPTLLTGELAA
ncbi:MAG: hypothetical protein QOE92_2362 [Chloroflexota bacterium]|jgi:hypothetical protein|nr:hypothetical protein [Chloroflexota bacterium]